MKQNNYSIIEREIADSSRNESKLENKMIALSLVVGSYAGIFVLTNIQYFEKLFRSWA